MAEISKELIIPVYLNQRIVFDLIAMLQGGLSTVTRVEKTEGHRENDQAQFGASFGLANALSALIKIDLSGKHAESTEQHGAVKTSLDRVHTPASMFQVLRTNLADNKQYYSDSTNYKPTIRDIFEFSTSVRRNPLIVTMDTLISLFDMILGFQTTSAGNDRKKKDEISSNIAVKKQMEQFSSDFKTGRTIDVVSEKLLCGYKSIITLEREFLNDPSMSDLADGHYTILGKIVRIIDSPTDSISLIRKSIVNALPRPIMEKLLFDLSANAEEHSFSIPTLELEIYGPVIQILPIAIFV